MGKVCFWVTIILLYFFNTNVFAQEGWQLSVQGSGGIGVISPQNHFSNPYYELDYKFKIGYLGQLNFGYGFNNQVALIGLAGYQKVNQDYKGDFSPGLGAPPQSHQKQVGLSFINFGVLAKYTTNFQDAYVYGNKAQLVVSGGLVMSKLVAAKLNYIANGELMPYPSKLIPYTDPEYPYSPQSDAKKLFSDWWCSFVLNVGGDIFISSKLAFSPSFQGQVSLTDVNNKDYRKHSAYKASRIFYGGLNLGLTYYINRE
ncbi:MAG: hypothetical protein M9958_01405 [Chitinophagales bacterium]|nr:hypothetical protein [Chitinophagales bacterium]